MKYTVEEHLVAALKAFEMVAPQDFTPAQWHHIAKHIYEAYYLSANLTQYLPVVESGDCCNARAIARYRHDAIPLSFDATEEDVTQEQERRAELLHAIRTRMNARCGCKECTKENNDI